MQGKSFVRFFTIALVLVVTYIFLLTIPTSSVERAAKNYAKTTAKVSVNADTSIKNKEDAEMLALKEDIAQQYFLDSISDEVVLNLGFKAYTFQELKRSQLAFGLDLQGGMSVVLQVNLTELIRTLAGAADERDPIDPELQAIIDKARKAMSKEQVDFVTLFGKEYKASTDKPLSRFFLTSNKLSGINVNSTNEEVLAAIREEASQTVERTFNLLKQRIDKFGVTSPTVSLDKSTDRITVELPGVKSPARARRMLQSTASLEFCEMYTAVEMLGTQTEGPLLRLNNQLKKNNEFNGNTSSSATPQVTDSCQTIIDSLKSDTTMAEATRDSIIGSITATCGVDSGAIEPLFSRAGFNQPKDEKDVMVLLVKDADTAIVMKMLRTPEAQKIVPARDYRFLWGAKTEKADNGGKVFYLYVIRTKNKSGELTGTNVTSSFPTSNPSGIGYSVSLAMNSEGARIWKKMTGANVGKSVAIVLDDKVQSSPVVQGEISGGNTSISGNFSANEATDLANVLSIGKLPAKPEIIEEAVVGPSLGANTVSAGLWALVIGLVLVLLFMLGYYAMGGMLAVLALFLNIFFIFGCLASFGTVLTLPGIAGIVLTIGMAVDANVIIFERIREELRLGEDWKDAIIKGFKNSYSAIIDSNVTSFVVALILFQYGLGPIKGFATVLMIGVACSIFAAVLFSRMVIDGYIVRNKPVSFWIGATKNVLANPKINFIGMRKIAYAVSGVLMIAGLVSIFTSGFELGVDFQGGRSYTVEFPKDVNIEELKVKLKDAMQYDKNVVKSYDKSNQAKITTPYTVEGDVPEIAKDSIVMSLIMKGCNDYAGTNVAYKDFVLGKGDKTEPGLYLNASSKVGPNIADDIRQSAFWSAILSLIFIFTYILIRFRKWQFSVGAVVALFHDVLIVAGLFSLLKGVTTFSLEIDQNFIAAILTIIGYSINDTVIVYDRIREEATLNPKGNIKDIVNLAINNTLSRTSITSMTTFLVVLILFFFGGSGIAGFAFALFLGLIVGTYSSIFIASPLVVDTTKDASSLKFDEDVDDEFNTDGEGGELVEDSTDETKA